ncbi:hypothetical protein K402DRAFT_324957, partial [Aulographum hederae CBS 113979]
SRLVPLIRIHKTWEAHTCRLQLLSRRDPRTGEPRVTCAIFFGRDFTHASSMAFQVRATDSFEKVEDRGGGKHVKYGVKFVDAKFPLPQPKGKEEKREAKEREKENGGDASELAPRLEDQFVCLSRLEYPGEHDDVTVWFRDERSRDELIRALPGEVRVGRAMTLRRKI